MELKIAKPARSTLPLAILAACLNIGLVTGNAMADELLRKGPSVFNYNFVELKYADADGGDGIALAGSGDIRENIALRFDYFGGDSDSLRLGATYYIQSGSFPRADLNFSAGVDRVEDEGGIYASAGTRYAFNDKVELNASIELNTVIDTDLNIRLAGLYEFSTGLSALLETYLGDNSSVAAGVRFYWR